MARAGTVTEGGGRVHRILRWLPALALLAGSVAAHADGREGGDGWLGVWAGPVNGNLDLIAGAVVERDAAGRLHGFTCIADTNGVVHGLWFGPGADQVPARWSWEGTTLRVGDRRPWGWGAGVLRFSKGWAGRSDRIDWRWQAPREDAPALQATLRRAARDGHCTEVFLVRPVGASEVDEAPGGPRRPWSGTWGQVIEGEGGDRLYREYGIGVVERTAGVAEIIACVRYAGTASVELYDTSLPFYAHDWRGDVLRWWHPPSAFRATPRGGRNVRYDAAEHALVEVHRDAYPQPFRPGTSEAGCLRRVRFTGEGPTWANAMKSRRSAGFR